MNLLFSNPYPLIFAHRGASANAPENTLSAFELAVNDGADAIELDVKLSADRQVVVFHDQALDRITGIKGRVRDFPLAELRRLDAGSIFSTRFAGERIPTLEEVFECVGKKIYINIELTNYATPFDPLPELVVSLAYKHRLENRVLFSSFLYNNLLRIRHIMPEAVVALLAVPGIKGSLARGWIGKTGSIHIIHPNVQDTTPQLVKKAKRYGWRVHTWTVNHPDEMRCLFNLGINGIFTDNPLVARQTLIAVS